MKSLFRRASTLGLVVFTLSSVAYADSHSSEFKILRLGTNLTMNDAVNVYTSAALHNPGACSDTSYYVVSSTVSAGGRELMSRMLISAHLAGRSIKLRISSSSCSTDNHPVYNSVVIYE